MSFLKSFWRDEQGQDLIEYTLLLAFVCLVGAAVFIPVGGQVSGVWGATCNVANKAASAAIVAGS